MTPATLQALRRLLFFSVPEAAIMIGDVTERSWRFWEDGKRPIPADVIERIRLLLDWRRRAAQTALDVIGNHRPAALVWYQSLDDWMTLPDREPVFWRPHCSVVAEMCATVDAIAVPFSVPNYRAWLGERGDAEAVRGAWAAEQIR